MKNPRLIILLISFGLLGYFLYPLFKNGFPSTDDGGWMIIRLSAFFETLGKGQFPVRYLLRLNNGYGYPVANFLYPLFMYVGVPIHLFGISYINTIKVILFLSVFGSFGLTLYWLKQKLSLLPSITGGLVYSLFPYHIFDLYKRGSVGEILAFTIVPLIFIFIDRKNIPLTALSIALLILAHNSLALLFMPLILLYLIFVSKFNYLETVKTLLLGLFLSAFFWIPALYDKQFTIFDSIKISDVTGYFINDDLTPYGLIGFFILITSTFFLLFKREKIYILFYFTNVFFLFFSLSISTPIWNIQNFSSLVQFPFRLIAVVSFCSAFLIAFILQKISHKKKLSFFFNRTNIYFDFRLI